VDVIVVVNGCAWWFWWLIDYHTNR
jgi:hypothetical protein